MNIEGYSFLGNPTKYPIGRTLVSFFSLIGFYHKWTSCTTWPASPVTKNIKQRRHVKLSLFGDDGSRFPEKNMIVLPWPMPILYTYTVYKYIYTYMIVHVLPYFNIEQIDIHKWKVDTTFPNHESLHNRDIGTYMAGS